MLGRTPFSMRAKSGTGIAFPAAPRNCLSETNPSGIDFRGIPCSFKISLVIIFRPSHVIQKPEDWERVLVRVGHIDFIIDALEPLMSATHASASGSSPRARIFFRTLSKFLRSVVFRELRPMPNSAAAVFVNRFCKRLRRDFAGTCRDVFCCQRVALQEIQSHVSHDQLNLDTLPQKAMS